VITAFPLLALNAVAASHAVLGAARPRNHAEKTFSAEYDAYVARTRSTYPEVAPSPHQSLSGRLWVPIQH
jgi:hypothetical protein